MDAEHASPPALDELNWHCQVHLANGKFDRELFDKINPIPLCTEGLCITRALRRLIRVAREDYVLRPRAMLSVLFPRVEELVTTSVRDGQLARMLIFQG